VTPSGRDIDKKTLGGSLALPTVSAWRVPSIAYEDLVLLVNATRRAFRDALQNRPERVPGYRPPALAGQRSVLHATLRGSGAVLAEARTGEMDLLDGAVAAGVLLARAALEQKARLANAGDDRGIELEWLGPAEYLDEKYAESGQWSEGLLHAFEPAAEGIGVEFRDLRGLTRPSQIVSLCYSPDLALQAAESAVGLRQIDKLHGQGDIRYFRFRAYHVWQEDAASRPVVLVRGEEYLPPAAVTAESLDAAIGRMGTYLRYRQNRDGWFSEEYLPSADKYSRSNSAALQMHALCGLAAYAAWTKQAEDRDAAIRGIRRNLPFLKSLAVALEGDEEPASGPVATTQAGSALLFPGHEAYLEVSSRLLWAMNVVDPSAFRSERAALLRAILAAQDSTGRIEMAFQPRAETDVEDVAAAGLAMLALAGTVESGIAPPAVLEDQTMGADPTAIEAQRRDVEAALAKSLRHYRDWFEKSPEPAAAATLARGLMLGYVLTNDARFSDLAFKILDRLAGVQLRSANCPWPELHGAINAREPGVVGADTARYLAALADGAAIARRIGDEARIARYERAVRGAARFVMQLEVRGPGCYYIRSRRDALGGVRRSSWNNGLRADDCAEAIISLSRARAVLFGPPAGRP